MKNKNEIITLNFKGIAIDAVVINFISTTYYDKTNETVTKYLCYAQNRLIIATETNGIITNNKIICDYCVIPEADEILKNHFNN